MLEGLMKKFKITLSVHMFPYTEITYVNKYIYVQLISKAFTLPNVSLTV